MKLRIVAVLVVSAVCATVVVLIYQALHPSFTHIAEFEVATSLKRFEVRDGQNRTLWRIDAVNNTKVAALDWGVVPSGFRQVTPAAGPPRPLHPEEPLLLVYATDEYWQRHEGQAVGSSAFIGGGWLQGPIGKPSAERVFSAEPNRIVLDPTPK